MVPQCPLQFYDSGPPDVKPNRPRRRCCLTGWRSIRSYRVSVGSCFETFDSGMGEPVGSGEIVSKTLYASRKAFRTDEPGTCWRTAR
jgi:hypothetical protein